MMSNGNTLLDNSWWSAQIIGGVHDTRYVRQPVRPTFLRKARHYRTPIFASRDRPAVEVFGCALLAACRIICERRELREMIVYLINYLLYL